MYALSRDILEGLKPSGGKTTERFWNSLESLQAGITFDPVGNPSFNVQPGEVRSSDTTLEEIFRYLDQADKPCIVAIN